MKKPFYDDSAKDGIGIDLGIRTMVTYAASRVSGRYLMASNSYNPAMDAYSNTIHDKINRLNEVISHKINCNKMKLGYNPNNPRARVRKDDIDSIYRSKAILRLRARITRLNDRLKHHKYDSLKKCISDLVRNKPEFITIEDLDVVAMMERRGSRSLRRSNGRSGFGWFRVHLIYKCKEYRIPLYEVPLYYPSSKQCSTCGNIRRKLDLSERVYSCPKCGLVIDRDINAARNMHRFGVLSKPDLIRLDTLEEMIEL